MKKHAEAMRISKLMGERHGLYGGSSLKLSKYEINYTVKRRWINVRTNSK
jgi:hypothetical protein